MKIRDDFVSNSSSTSYVLAISKNYDLLDFCRDVACRTVSPGDRYHDKKLLKLNEINLAFSLLHYELIYLGEMEVAVVTNKIKHSDIPVKMNNYEFTEDDWIYYSENIEKWNKIKDNPAHSEYNYLKRHSSDSYIENDILHLVDHEYIGGIAIDLENDYSVDTYSIKRHSFIENDIDNGTANVNQIANYEKNRIKRIECIKKFTREFYETGRTGYSSYQITMNTIKNTKDLISAGVKIEFNKWENVELLEKRLKAGEKIFMIRNNYSGDGYLSDGIYTEDGSPGIGYDSGIDTEFLTSECC